MLLKDAVRLKPGQTVAFVGAGGKSSGLLCFINEWQHSSVILMTTTKIWKQQSRMAGKHIIVDKQSLQELGRACDRADSVFLTGPLDENGQKWTGVPETCWAGIHALVCEKRAVLIIEADGARGRSFKAPAANEPVIPSFCDKVVIVLGLDVLGQSLDSGLYHRSEHIQDILGCAADHTLSQSDLVRVLASTQGGHKNIPPSAEVIVMLNKADQLPDLQGAYQLADLILEQAVLVQSVVIGNVQSRQPVVESVGRVAAVMLAAGGSTRLGRPKQTLDWHGQSLIQHALRTIHAAELDQVVVVSGAADEELRAALPDFSGDIIHNPDWKQGAGSSVRAGVQQLAENTAAVILMLVDMPLIQPALLKALIKRHHTRLSSIIVPFHEGRRGNPVLFDRRTFSALSALQGDVGGRALFDQFGIDRLDWDATIHMDIDDMDDYWSLLARE